MSYWYCPFGLSCNSCGAPARPVCTSSQPESPVSTSRASSIGNPLTSRVLTILSQNLASHCDAPGPQIFPCHTVQQSPRPERRLSRQKVLLGTILSGSGFLQNDQRSVYFGAQMCRRVSSSRKRKEDQDDTHLKGIYQSS